MIFSDRIFFCFVLFGFDIQKKDDVNVRRFRHDVKACVIISVLWMGVLQLGNYRSRSVTHLVAKISYSDKALVRR